MDLHIIAGLIICGALIGLYLWAGWTIIKDVFPRR